ncbi:MAG: hypothetical protein V8R81_01595 [Clostridia bacterium]
MATSGSVETNRIAATSRKWYWQLIWSSSYSGNTATVNWEIYARCEGGTSGSTWVANYGFGGNVNGQNLSFSGRFYKDARVASGSFQIGGGNSFSASITAHPYSGSHTSSGNWSWTMDNKVVTPTVTCSVTRGLNTIGASMSVTNDGRASIVDRYIDLFTDSGCSNKVGTISGASGTFTGLEPNKTYYARANASNGTYRGYSSVKTVSTYDIARLTEAPDVNIGSAHTIKWTNPSGATISLALYKTDGKTLVYNVGNIAGTSKSVTPTASEIYKLIPNTISIKLRYIITTTANNKSYTNYKECTFSVTNSNPTFSNFTYADTNSKTLALTGNNQIVIKGYSNVKGIVSVSNKAVAKNSATMAKYRLVIGESQKEANYSSDAEVGITIANANNNVFNMYAIDSRGYSTLKTISPSTYKTYSDINVKSAVAERQENGISSNVILSFNGDIWNNSFGNVNNEITSCVYRYKKTTSNTWITGKTDIMPVVNGQSYSKSVSIKGDLEAEGFDIRSSYNLQIIIKDKLSSYTYETLIGTGTPGIAITADGIAFFNMYDESLGGAVQITGDLYVNGKKINS